MNFTSFIMAVSLHGLSVMCMLWWEKQNSAFYLFSNWFYWRLEILFANI